MFVCTESPLSMCKDRDVNEHTRKSAASWKKSPINQLKLAMYRHSDCFPLCFSLSLEEHILRWLNRYISSHVAPPITNANISNRNHDTWLLIALILTNYAAAAPNTYQLDAKKKALHRTTFRHTPSMQSTNASCDLHSDALRTISHWILIAHYLFNSVFRSSIERKADNWHLYFLDKYHETKGKKTSIDKDLLSRGGEKGGFLRTLTCFWDSSCRIWEWNTKELFYFKARFKDLSGNWDSSVYLSTISATNSTHQNLQSLTSRLAFQTIVTLQRRLITAKSLFAMRN